MNIKRILSVTLVVVGMVAANAMATDSTSIRPPNVVYKKPAGSSANYATSADSATHASSANYATNAGDAANADHAKTADSATRCTGSKTDCNTPKPPPPPPIYQFKGVYSTNGKITYVCQTPGTARGMKQGADKSVAASKKWYNKVKDVPKSYFLFGLGGPNIGCPVASGARTGTVRTFMRTKIKQRVK
jgi:hypothetical protein